MSDEFADIFATLRGLMLEAAPDMVVTDDRATAFTMKTPWIEARTKEPAWFGWIAIKKSYVSYHLMPLYTLPDLVAAVPPKLEPRRQGKTCFNFKKSDPALFADLAELTRTAAGMDAQLKAAIG